MSIFPLKKVEKTPVMEKWSKNSRNCHSQTFEKQKQIYDY